MLDCSSDSSDEEITKEALKEATDPEFFKDSLFRKDQTASDSTGCLELKPEIDEKKHSLKAAEYSDNFNPFGVTQNFKDFVAKKLSERLDRNIEFVEVKEKKKKKKKGEQVDENGIKLLSSSTIALTGEQDPEEIVINKRHLTYEISDDDLLKCKEAAIDSLIVLSKREVQFWSERSKGKVFKYKQLPNGTLIEQQSAFV